jgi:SAM-dependent methyltransferase
MVDTDNVRGHRARLERLMRGQPREAALEQYVGGGARYSIGHREKEAIAKHRDLQGAYILDIGCGIGRLTQALIEEPIRCYLGTDIISEVLDEARAVAAEDSRFKFRQVDGLTIPEDDGRVDIACGFSLITHLLDEQVFACLRETARVLATNGIAVFSFLDFGLPRHQEQFAGYAGAPALGRRDILKWFEKDTLSFFARENGMEVVEFQDAYTPSPAKYPDCPLPDGSRSAKVLVMGQSLAYFRKK